MGTQRVWVPEALELCLRPRVRDYGTAQPLHGSALVHLLFQLINLEEERSPRYATGLIIQNYGEGELNNVMSLVHARFLQWTRSFTP